MVTACVHKHMGIELKWRNFTSADGTITTSVRQGLRTLAELANLFHVLQANGIDPFIVSASLETAVAAFATNPLFGYGLPRSHVLGMRLSQVNGHLGTSYQQVNTCACASRLLKTPLLISNAPHCGHHHHQPGLACHVSSRQGQSNNHGHQVSTSVRTTK